MSKNKSLSFIALLAAVLLILPGASLADQPAQGQTNKNGITFGFRLTGGAFPLMRNDINDHLQGINDIFDYYSYYNPYYTLNSEYEMIKMGMDFSGEILISFLPHFSIGVGAGYIGAGKDSTMEVMDTIYSIENTHTYHTKFSVIPITLSLYYGIPVGNSMKVVLNAGRCRLAHTVGLGPADRGEDIVGGTPKAHAWPPLEHGQGPAHGHDTDNRDDNHHFEEGKTVFLTHGHSQIMKLRYLEITSRKEILHKSYQE